MESFFGSLKTELEEDRPFPTRQATRSALSAFIEGFYNRVPTHTGRGHYRLAYPSRSRMHPEPPAKPKLSAAEAKIRKADRLQTIRLQMAIYRTLDDRGITTPDGIGAALEMPADQATALLSRKRLHNGDLERLEAAAAHLGLRV